MVPATSTLQQTSKENKNSVCKHCQRKVVNKVKCMKCGDLFHPACLKQASEYKNSECKHEPEHNQIDITLTEVDYLKEENRLLKQIVQDKDTIINDKESIIILLTDKIALLEEKMKKCDDYASEPYTKTVEPRTKIQSAKKRRQQTNKPDDIVDDKNINPNIEGKSVLQGDSNIRFEAQTKETLPNSSHFENNNGINNSKKKNDEPSTIKRSDNFVESKEDWKTVEIKRGRSYGRNNTESRPEPIKGTNEVSELRVAKKYSWLFLSGFDKETTSTEIQEFVKRKGAQECSCEQLKTRKDNLYASFKLGIPEKDKMMIMDASLWPKGIRINHFLNLNRPSRRNK